MKKQKILYHIFAIIALLLGGTQGYQLQIPEGGTLNGIVTYVTDGDTIRVNGIKLRLWGVDAPEKDQPYFAEATDFMTRQALFSQVTCLIHDKDRYERWVGQCMLTSDQSDLAMRLVEAGLAKDYKRHSKRYYLPAQIKAQMHRKGMWQ